MKNIFLTGLLFVTISFSSYSQDASTSFYVYANSLPQSYGWHFKAGQTVYISASGSWYSNGEKFSYKGKAHKDGLSVRPNIDVMSLLVEIRDGNHVYNDDFTGANGIYYTFMNDGYVNFACNDDLWTDKHRLDNSGRVVVTMEYYANYKGSTRLYKHQARSSFERPR